MMMGTTLGLSLLHRLVSFIVYKDCRHAHPTERSPGIRGTVEIFEKFRDGLKDIESFSRIVLYAFHRCQSYQLTVTPFLDTIPRGVFATRAPCRPNPIGFSTVRLIKARGTTLVVEDVDILDTTPLLDLKPCVPAFDSYPDATAGWLEHVANGAESVRSDKRFK